MDDEVGLINMNARIYDPYLGRFLSADPVLPDATDMQQFNRYAYVTNNPLKFTDPTGHEGFAITFSFFGGFFSFLGGGGSRSHCIVSDSTFCRSSPSGDNQSNEYDEQEESYEARYGYPNSGETNCAIESDDCESANDDGSVQGQGPTIRVSISYGRDGKTIDVDVPVNINKPDESCNTRRCVFDRAKYNLTQAGLLEGHNVAFIDQFAVGTFNDRGDVTNLILFDTQEKADLAIQLGRDSGLDIGRINGLTEVGSPNSVVFAGATLPRTSALRTSEHFPSIPRSELFEPVNNAMFVILHETQHGKGVVTEEDANRKALIQLDRYLTAFN